jgi:predicted DNA-binding transcriptional regulator AlpA
MVLGKKVEKMFFRPDEVCKILDIERTTFYRLVNQVDSPLPAVKMNESPNGHLRVPKLELERWLQEHKKDPLNE